MKGSASFLLGGSAWFTVNQVFRFTENPRLCR